MKLNAVLQQLQQRIEAASREQRPLEHILLCGSPLQTEQIMQFLKQYRPGGFPYIATARIERAGDLAAILTQLKQGDILYLNEIHRLSRAVGEVLYPAMVDFALDIVIGKGTAAKNVRLNLQHFTVIGATTPLALSGPLRDRFGAKYTIDDDGEAAPIGIKLQ